MVKQFDDLPVPIFSEKVMVDQAIYRINIRNAIRRCQTKIGKDNFRESLNIKYFQETLYSKMPFLEKNVILILGVL